eukprot:CAMPEP_0171568534 /NCGR_PEP_ID=MMETSP0961-20121227/1819_1 /TAXON_ID=87120 /ORGANISM="Aurantiochytrium limacinum, Strain ATCCMYA-1381" /LENGTH=43 /DNA_ID= /DNA_START= /DNA_END= /DNA_ORIENTATION=
MSVGARLHEGSPPSLTPGIRGAHELKNKKKNKKNKKKNGEQRH